MSGQEHEAQRREVFGADIASCDLCGTPFPAHQLSEISSGSPLSGHDHALRICATCQERILSGELDVKTILFDEDEYPEPESEY